MKFSIVIPQLFYDLIARILPGFFFLMFVQLSLPELTRYLYPIWFIGGNNFVHSFWQGVGYAIFCYFFGWLFLSFTWSSKRDEVREIHEKDTDTKSLKAKLQWIRLAHPLAGFRIVKLRAEARMCEVTRTALVVFIGLAIVYFLVLLILMCLSLYSPYGGFFVKPLIGILVATVSAYGFRKREERAWDHYWANIRSIYKVLHDSNDPINLPGEDKD